MFTFYYSESNVRNTNVLILSVANLFALLSRHVHLRNWLHNQIVLVVKCNIRFVMLIFQFKYHNLFYHRTYGTEGWYVSNVTRACLYHEAPGFSGCHIKWGRVENRSCGQNISQRWIHQNTNRKQVSFLQLQGIYVISYVDYTAFFSKSSTHLLFDWWSWLYRV